MPTRALVTNYRDDLKLFAHTWQKLGLVVGGAFVLTYPFWVSGHWLTIANQAMVAVVGSIALMVLTGFAGQISMGHAAFLALGAYTTAILGTRWGVPFWMSLPLSGLVAAGVGLAIGFFALRLKGLYLAIVTIGLLVLVEHTLLAFPEWTQGHSGIRVPMHLWFPAGDGVGTAIAFKDKVMLGPLFFTFERKLFFLFLGITLVVMYVAKNIHRSDTGRAMMAVRDHDLAASTLGVNPTRAKIQAFAVSSFLAGIAGAMFAYKQTFISVNPPFNLNMSVAFIAMIVLGGMGTVFGAVAGGLAFTFLSPLAEIFHEWCTTGPATANLCRRTELLQSLSSEQFSTIVFALVVIVFMVFEPMGLFGLWMRVKRYFMAWPFKY